MLRFMAAVETGDVPKLVFCFVLTISPPNVPKTTETSLVEPLLDGKTTTCFPTTQHIPFPHGRVEHKARLILDQLCIPSGTSTGSPSPSTSLPPAPGFTASERVALWLDGLVGIRWVSRADTCRCDSLLRGAQG